MGVKNRNWSGIIVTISTAIFAIVSIVSVVISVSTWQVQREAARPYFTFSDSPTIHLSDELSFELKFINVGAHPASNLFSRTIVFEEKLLQDPLLVDDYTVVNDIPRDTTTSLLISLKIPAELQTNINPQFLVVCLNYTDPITRQKYTQTIYTKWAGVIAQKPQSIVHVEVSEKQAIINYLKAHHLLESKYLL